MSRCVLRVYLCKYIISKISKIQKSWIEIYYKDSLFDNFVKCLQQLNLGNCRQILKRSKKLVLIGPKIMVFGVD